MLLTERQGHALNKTHLLYSSSQFSYHLLSMTSYNAYLTAVLSSSIHGVGFTFIALLFTWNKVLHSVAGLLCVYACDYV